MKKDALKYNQDYLILRGNSAGRICRFVGQQKVKKYGSFMSVRGNELRVNCAENGFATIPKLGCWMEHISSAEKMLSRPPILLIQAKSIVGDIPMDCQNFAIREDNELIALWTYRHNLVQEAFDLSKIEETIVKLGKKNDSLLCDNAYINGCCDVRQS